MENWHAYVQKMVEEIDQCIKQKVDDAMTLSTLGEKWGYSPSYVSRKFKEISGMQFREYLRLRKLAFAVKDIRDSNESLLNIALDYGFSSHEAFTRAFKDAYGITPSEYREKPIPLALRTIIKPLDCYLHGNCGNMSENSAAHVKTYFVSIPAHKFLHIRNYESVGYWDFWQKQSLIPGQDCETICGLLDSIPDKLDDLGGNEINSGSGQIMGFINEPTGRICSWGIPLAECYGVRLPLDYDGPVPEQMMLMEVPEGEYIAFEHGPFDYAAENCLVESRIENAMRAFDYAAAGYQLDLAPGRIFYFYHDCQRFWKYIRPVKRI